MLPPRAADTGQGASLVVVDYRTDSVTAGPAEAAGVLVAELEPVPAGFLWLVERINVLCDSTTPTQAAVYAGYPTAANFVDGTDRGNLDTADEASPILVDSNVSLTCIWSGASVGASATVRVQYQLVQRS